MYQLFTYNIIIIYIGTLVRPIVLILFKKIQLRKIKIC